LSQRVLGLRPLGAMDPAGAGDYAVEPSTAGLTFCNGSATFGGGHVELSWSTDAADSTDLSRTFHLELDATEAPQGSAARIGLPIPRAADKTSLTIIADAAGVVWSAELGAAAGTAVDGVDFGAARVADGRVWLELTEARKLSLTLQ
jgi:hypothetical protein